MFVCSLARLLARRWWWWSLRPRTMSSGLRMPNCTTCTLRVGAEEYFSVAMVDTARSGRRSGALAVCVAACYARGTTNETNAHTHTSKDERRCYQCALALSRARERVRGRAVSVWICGGYSRSFARSLSVCLRARLQAARQLNRANALRLCCGCCCLRAREEERQSAEAGPKYPSCPGGPADYHGNVGTELRVRYAAPASPALPRFVGLFARRPPLLAAAPAHRTCGVGM